LKGIGSSAALFVSTSLAIARSAFGSDGLARGASFAEPDQAIWIAYDAPSLCPGAEVFMDRVHARTAHGDLAPSAEVARFRVIVSSGDMSSSARIQFIGADAQPATRTVSGRTCDEVVSAAALITALAIEATWSGAPPAPEESAPPARPSAPSDATLPPSESRSSWPRGWGLGAAGGIDSWTPGGGYGGGVWGEMLGRPPLELVQLAFRATTGSASVDARSARFKALMARLSLCPISLRIADRILLFPCAAVDVGRLAAEGQISAALSGPRTTAIFWSSAEAVLAMRWDLGEWIALEAGAELGFPLIRHTFIFEGPAQVVDEVPVVGAGAHAACVLRFH
jgi:hypothetical protein